MDPITFRRMLRAYRFGKHVARVEAGLEVAGSDLSGPDCEGCGNNELRVLLGFSEGEWKAYCHSLGCPGW